MPRIIKKPEIRRQEILAAAEKLLAKNGYENTSIEAIIKDAGIAKGTFYYYFKSKKEILHALVELARDDLLAYFEATVAKSNLNANQKLKLMLCGHTKKALTASPVMAAIHHPENRELQEQLNIQIVETIAPLIIQVLEQGKKEGVFQLAPSLEKVQLLLAGSQFILDSGLFPWQQNKRRALLQALQNMLEQIAGVKSNTFAFITNKYRQERKT